MPASPEEMAQTMILNMPEKTGKSLDEWLVITRESGLEKHGQIVKMLKTDHGVTHGFANTIAHETLKAAAGGEPTGDALLSAQYAGAKANLRPLYDSIVAAVDAFGDDVEVAPRKTYVTLRRNKQFGIVKAATSSRIDVGVNLKDVASTDRLVPGKSFSGMCSHQVSVTDAGHIDDELIGWLKQAYEQS